VPEVDGVAAFLPRYLAELGSHPFAQVVSEILEGDLVLDVVVLVSDRRLAVLEAELIQREPVQRCEE
jgi:hypothetical protein